MYAWGFLGGFVGALVLYVAPTMIKARLAGDTFRLTPARVLTVLLVTVVLAALGGLVALAPAHVTGGEAVVIGLAMQAIVRGLISSARDALPSEDSRDLD